MGNRKNPPHIASIPLAAAATETSSACVITDTTTDPDHPHKYVAFDDASVTTLAIDDPVLYYSSPIDYPRSASFSSMLAHACQPLGCAPRTRRTSLGNTLYAIKLTPREPACRDVERPGPGQA